MTNLYTYLPVISTCIIGHNIAEKVNLSEKPNIVIINDKSIYLSTCDTAKISKIVLKLNKAAGVDILMQII